MKKSDFIKELEEVFSLPEGSLKESDTLKELDVDSTGMLGLILLLTSKLGMKVDIEAFDTIKTVHDIIIMTDGRVL
jgi:acyl carrier protein